MAKPDAQSLETIQKSFSVAEKLGIQGTPATLIGDEMLSGWIPGSNLMPQSAMR